MTQFWLIRHAPVDGPHGVIHDIDAPADVGDTAALLRLRSLLPKTHVAISSPARRARDTADALGLVAGFDPAFGEQDFGRWTGRTHEDIRREFEAAYDDFWHAPATNRPPGGESFVDADRAGEVRDRGAAAGDVIVVAHAGTIRAALAVALDIPPDKALSFVIYPLSLTRLDRLDNGWRVVAVNRI